MIYGYDLWLVICPADLLICICSCELYKLLTHSTLLLQSCCRLCSPPWITSSRWTVKEQCSVLIRLLHLLTKLTISVYKSALSLISPVPSFSFLMLQRFFVIYHFLQSRRAEHFLWSDSGLKQFTPVSPSLPVICYYPSPAISVLLSPVGFFNLFVSWWCMRSSIEELIWTTNNFILFYVKQVSLAVVLHSTSDDVLQQYERTTKILRAL